MDEVMALTNRRNQPPPFTLQVQWVCHNTLPWLISVSLGLRMKLLLDALALISAGLVAADCPKPADWARAFYSEHYFFYAGAPDPILQLTTLEFGAGSLLRRNGVAGYGNCLHCWHLHDFVTPLGESLSYVYSAAQP